MNHKVFIVVGFFGLGAAACSGSNDGAAVPAQANDRLVLDVRCAADGDCPAGFECEVETEKGVSQSYCISHGGGGGGASKDGGGATGASCPPGYELEVEHGTNFCKPHGGGSSGSGGSGGGSGVDAGTTTASCVTDADCGPGLECEVETEHGVTTSWCKAHGSSGSGK